jgi:hypothetical protein
MRFDWTTEPIKPPRYLNAATWTQKGSNSTGINTGGCPKIAACAKRISSIRTAVLVSIIVLHGPDRELIQYPQYVIEAEHQRKLAADIQEIELSLAAACTHATPPVIPSIVASQYPPHR